MWRVGFCPIDPWAKTQRPSPLALRQFVLITSSSWEFIRDAVVAHHFGSAMPSLIPQDREKATGRERLRDRKQQRNNPRLP